MTDQPNILVIWADDIGISNLSCYSEGLMGYRTPNIDRIAADGAPFTDFNREQSCTAGRAGIIPGQNPYRCSSSSGPLASATSPSASSQAAAPSSFTPTARTSMAYSPRRWWEAS